MCIITGILYHCSSKHSLSSRSPSKQIQPKVQGIHGKTSPSPSCQEQPASLQLRKDTRTDSSHSLLFIFSHVLCRDLQPFFLLRILWMHPFVICILLEKNNAYQNKYNFKVTGQYHQPTA